MEGTPSLKNGIHCGGTEVPTKLIRELLRAMTRGIIGKSDGHEFQESHEIVLRYKINIMFS